MTTIIKNGRIIFKNRIVSGAFLYMRGSKILRISRRMPSKGAAAVIDARGAFIAPGFIDTHIHGSPEEVIANETRYGTTSFLVAVSCGRPVPDISGFDNALGVRLEGPYINEIMAGAQDSGFIEPPSVKGLIKIIKEGKGAIRMMTLAPELKGAAPVIKACLRQKVVPSIGHSAATYEQAQEAFDRGVRHVTHIFNAISGPRHGTAGASMAALFDNRVVVEVIADLVHVKKDLLKQLFALKEKDRIILVTDSVRAGSSGHKSGSGLTMIRAVRNVVKHCGVSIVDAVAMASLNPARLLGVDGRTGSIATGKDADIVMFDKNFDVKMTMIRGRIVFQKGKSRCAA